MINHDGKVQGGSLPTFCYCNYRLLRAMKLASADKLIKLMGQDFNPYWFVDMNSNWKDLTELAIPWWLVRSMKMSSDRRSWHPVRRSSRVDFTKFKEVPNRLRRILFSKKGKGNPMDALLCFWFSKNAAYLPFRQLKDGVLHMELSDPKSPGTFKTEFIVRGQKYRVITKGIRTPRKRRVARKGKSVQVTQSAEQAQTTAERTIEKALATGNRVQASNFKNPTTTQWQVGK